LFGGGLFGNNQQTQNQQQPAQNSAFGLFGGNKPATPAAPSGGLFGNNTFGQTGTNANAGGQQNNMFGNPLGQSTTQQPGIGGFGNSVFNKPAAPALGQSQSMGQSGGGLFNSFGNTGTLNATATAHGAQGTLTASIAQPIGANLPIFSMLPPGPRAVTLDQQPKKKPGFFVDVPTRSPVPRLQLGYTPANTKLRGFASDQLSSSLSFSSGKPNALSLSRVDTKTPTGPDVFLGRSSSPSLGSGGRQSVKKLILDKKVEPSDLFSKAGSPGLRGGPVKVTFNPAMSQAARERDVARETANGPASPTLNVSHGSPAPRPSHLPNHFSAHSTNHVIDPKEKGTSVADSQNVEPQEGDYWVKPDLDTLRQAGYSQLSSFENLVVGRIGYGEIRFLDPVDLTGLSKLDELRGLVVRFDDKECTVYPDSDDADKPSPGTGLNVRARIILVRCWAVDKSTREPIKDEKHPSAVKHFKRLKNMRDTHFESFDLSEGKWTFTVDHF
jgi:nuclear pore complex protein Nup98-Nup96